MTQGRCTIAVVAAFLLVAVARAEHARPSALTDAIGALPQDLELQLALSALPRHLRDDATVYVLNPASGFAVLRNGTNGFHAFVARTGDDTFRGSWTLTKYRDDILYPVAFDSAGPKAHMRIFFDAAELQAKGTPAPELKKLIQRRLRAGVYKAPTRAGVAYMLSPIMRGYVRPDDNDAVFTANFPHVMYYAPDVSNEDVGGGTPGGMVPFVVLPGHHGYMIQPLGLTERASINSEFAQMLARLCNINALWCLPTAVASHSHVLPLSPDHDPN
jgi:hypothetical protein